ncbi:MAG: MarR family transcriptional regulator [Candidatus Caldarchaeum sp.]
MTRPAHMVEEVLKTYVHIRVLKILSSSKEPLTKYQLAKQAATSLTTISKIVEDLSKHGWISRTNYRPVKYLLNRTPVVNRFLEFLSETGYV